MGGGDPMAGSNAVVGFDAMCGDDVMVGGDPPGLRRSHPTAQRSAPPYAAPKRQSQQQTMARTASAPSLRKKAGAETAGDFDSLDELSTRASTGKTASVMGGTIKG